MTGLARVRLGGCGWVGESAVGFVRAQLSWRERSGAGESTAELARAWWGWRGHGWVGESAAGLVRVRAQLSW